MSTWRHTVWQAVRLVPRGRVVSYGDVAAFVGHPRRARQVGTALGLLEGAGLTAVPWQRVVNARGFLSIRGAFASKDVQRALLREEGVPVDADHLVVDFARVRWAYPAPGSSGGPLHS